jgi:hypothetical protein
MDYCFADLMAPQTLGAFPSLTRDTSHIWLTSVSRGATPRRSAYALSNGNQK